MPLQGSDAGRPHVGRKYRTEPAKIFRARTDRGSDVRGAAQEDFRQSATRQVYRDGIRLRRTLPSRALAYKVTSGRSMTKGSR